MSKRIITMLSLALAFSAAACGAATIGTAGSPAAGAPAPSAAAPRPTPSASPLPTPLLLSISGHARTSDGLPVSGVRVRVNPADISGADTTWGARERVPGPDAIVMSDAAGAFSATVSAWSLEALARSSSSQLSLFVTPPAGMKIIAITQADGFPNGPLAPNDPQWYFMLAREINGPIDITLAPQ